MHRIGPFTKPKGEGPVATTNDAIQQLIKTMNAISGVQLELKVAAAEGLGHAGGEDARAALIKIVTAISGTPLELKAAAARALGRAARG